MSISDSSVWLLFTICIYIYMLRFFFGMIYYCHYSPVVDGPLKELNLQMPRQKKIIITSTRTQRNNMVHLALCS